jgi:hypothetical protein
MERLDAMSEQEQLGSPFGFPGKQVASHWGDRGALRLEHARSGL